MTIDSATVSPWAVRRGAQRMRSWLPFPHPALGGREAFHASSSPRFSNLTLRHFAPKSALMGEEWKDGRKKRAWRLLYKIFLGLQLLGGGSNHRRDSGGNGRVCGLNILPPSSVVEDGAALVEEVVFDGVKTPRILGLGIHGEPRDGQGWSFGSVLAHPGLDVPHLRRREGGRMLASEERTVRRANGARSEATKHCEYCAFSSLRSYTSVQLPLCDVHHLHLRGSPR